MASRLVFRNVSKFSVEMDRAYAKETISSFIRSRRNYDNCDLYFSDFEIYRTHHSGKAIKRGINLRFFASIPATFVGGMLFVKTSGLLAIIPAWIASGLLASCLMEKRSFRRLTHKIILHKDLSLMHIETVLGTKVIAPLDSFELTDIMKIEPENVPINQRKSGYLVKFDIRDKNSFEYKDLTIVIHEGEAVIDNLFFFLCLINKDVKMIEQFKFDPEQKSQRRNEKEEELQEIN